MSLVTVDKWECQNVYIHIKKKRKTERYCEDTAYDEQIE